MLHVSPPGKLEWPWAAGMQLTIIRPGAAYMLSRGGQTCLRLGAAQPSKLCQYGCPFCQCPAALLQELLLHLKMNTFLARGSNGSQAAAEHRLASSILLHSSRAARLQKAPALVVSMPAVWDGSTWPGLRLPGRLQSCHGQPRASEIL